jgi:hypothetical protein
MGLYSSCRRVYPLATLATKPTFANTKIAEIAAKFAFSRLAAGNVCLETAFLGNLGGGTPPRQFRQNRHADNWKGRLTKTALTTLTTLPT